MADGKKTYVCRVGNPKLDLILSQWIDEDLIENDCSEIELYDSDNGNKDHITGNIYHTDTDNLRLIDDDSDEEIDSYVIIILVLPKIISN